MADVSDLKVQLTITLGELRTLVGLLNLATFELLPEGSPDRETAEPLASEISGLYFDLMENLREGIFEDFDAE